jgi:hypothetical protein
MGYWWRPLKFKSVEILQEKIDKYFKETPKDEWTITWLAVFLDTSRETLINYQEKEEYFDTIKKAKDMVEMWYEIDLKKKGNTWTIFALKNFWWVDKTEVDNNTKMQVDITQEWSILLDDINN